jgi:hypothetical protein
VVSTSEILRRDRQRKEEKREEREQRRGIVLLRPKEIWKRLGCGRTKFYEDFVATGRIKLADIGPNAKGAPEYEVDEVIAEIIAERDAKLLNNGNGKSAGKGRPESARETRTAETIRTGVHGTTKPIAAKARRVRRAPA